MNRAEQLLAGAPKGLPFLLSAQSDSDETTIALWLHGRAAGTRRAYEGDAWSFLALSGKPLRAVTVGDVQSFGDSLTHLATASQARKLSAVKSLLTFANVSATSPSTLAP